MIKRLLGGRPVLTFIILGMSFGAFGLVTFDLLFLLRANLTLFWDYGVMVIKDGALTQLVELVLLGYLAMACYIVFKSCEHLLVAHLSGRHAGAHSSGHDGEHTRRGERGKSGHPEAALPALPEFRD